MEQPASQDFWPDLTDLAGPAGNGPDSRATLLRVSAEMFVAAPSRDREAVETFESLALGFLPTIDAASLVEIARVLAPCPEIPDAVRTWLLRHSDKTRDVMIDTARHATADHSPKRFGSWESRLALAASPGLDAAILRKLLVLEEDAVDDNLAANRHFAACDEGFAELLDRARHRTALAHILLAREDLALHEEAALYLAGSPQRRADMRHRIAESIAHRRALLSFSLSREDVDALQRAAKHGDAASIEAFFNTAFGFADTTAWRLLRIDRHDLLALALKALGMKTRDAIRIFIALHPALSHPLSRLKALIRTMHECESAVALAIIEAVLDVRALSARD